LGRGGRIRESPCLTNGSNSYETNPVPHLPKKPKKSNLLEKMRARELLARAPKTVLVAAIVITDVLTTVLLVPRANTASAPEDALTCEHGSCQRQAANGSPGADTANIPLGKPRLLEFTSQHCPSCGKMAPLVHKMERECTAHDGTILPVDVDTDTGDRLATRYRVRELPTFVMIDSKGAEVGRLVGEQPRQRLVVALADVNGVLCTSL